MSEGAVELEHRQFLESRRQAGHLRGIGHPVPVVPRRIQPQTRVIGRELFQGGLAPRLAFAVHADFAKFETLAEALAHPGHPRVDHGVVGHQIEGARSAGGAPGGGRRPALTLKGGFDGGVGLLHEGGVLVGGIEDDLVEGPVGHRRAGRLVGEKGQHLVQVAQVPLERQVVAVGKEDA